ncbi:MAG: Sjogren's syndrome/scleroderma autoantigen 1 family protein [Methanosarcinaceae archaeon]
MNSDDEQVRKISRLLELGGTMLAEHCNMCGSPMFRYRGNVICPVCDTREEKQFAQVTAIPSLTSSQKQASEPTPEPTQRSISQITGTSKAFVSGGGVESLEELLLEKITSIANSMQDETDTRRISEQLDIIERGLNIIEKLKNIV